MMFGQHMRVYSGLKPNLPKWSSLTGRYISFILKDNMTDVRISSNPQTPMNTAQYQFVYSLYRFIKSKEGVRHR
jgi:hypothetical protein